MRTPKQNLNYWKQQRRIMTIKRKVREFFYRARFDAKTGMNPANAKAKQRN